MNLFNWYKGRKVFITGHTGFKGSWMSQVLLGMGADVTGFALEPPTDPSLFEIAGLEKDIESITGDIRDKEAICEAIARTGPDVVIHMAAQPIVRESYDRPVYTFETNVMGTVNLLEAVRHCDRVSSVVNVTTDKVYENKEWDRGYRETDRLNGYDPYSNSKSCSELVTSSYRNAYFVQNGLPVSTARAGNAIGGGDFVRGRIIPDCMYAAMDHEIIKIRNPHSVRPYQHVLEPVFAYLLIAAMQADDQAYADCYNIGSGETDHVETEVLVASFCRHWGEGLSWKAEAPVGPYETKYLKLDCTKMRSTFDWNPKWNIDRAIRETVDWIKAWQQGLSVSDIMRGQINSYAQDFVE